MSLALSLILSGQASVASATTTGIAPIPSVQLVATTTPSLPSAQSIKEYVAQYFAKEPIMIAIAGCESHDHQYNIDGSVYRGQINNKDVGVMQINEYYQGNTAQKLGFNLYTLQGNVAYAHYLYEKQGTQPWFSSSTCWGKSDAAKALATTQK